MGKKVLIILIVLAILAGGGFFYYSKFMNASADVSVKANTSKINNGIAFRAENLKGKPLAKLKILGTYYIRGKYENNNDVWLAFDFNESTDANGAVLITDAKLKTQKKYFPPEINFKSDEPSKKFIDMDTEGLYVSYSSRLPGSNQYITKASDGFTVVFPQLLAIKKMAANNLIKMVAGTFAVNIDINFVSVNYQDLKTLSEQIKLYVTDQSQTNEDQLKITLQKVLRLAAQSQTLTVNSLPPISSLTPISTAFDNLASDPENIAKADLAPLQTALQSGTDNINTQSAVTTGTTTTGTTTQNTTTGATTATTGQNTSTQTTNQTTNTANQTATNTNTTTDTITPTTQKTTTQAAENNTKTTTTQTPTIPSNTTTITYEMTASALKSFNFRYSMATSRVETIRVNQTGSF